jgi:hypothetical protein
MPLSRQNIVHDRKEFGDKAFLTPDEIEDVVEYVLRISGRQADPVRAARCDIVFHDGSKDNCFDCHGVDGTGSTRSDRPTSPGRSYISGVRTAGRSMGRSSKGAAAPRLHARVRNYSEARRDQGHVRLRVLSLEKVISAALREPHLLIDNRSCRSPEYLRGWIDYGIPRHL